MLPLRGASHLLQKKCYAGWNMGLRGHTDTGYYLGCRWLMKLDPCQKVDVALFIVCILFSFHQLIIIDQSEDFGIEKLTIVVIKSCLRFHTHAQYVRAMIEVRWMVCYCQCHVTTNVMERLRFYSVTNWLKSLFWTCDELILYFGSQVLDSNT